MKVWELQRKLKALHPKHLEDEVLIEADGCYAIEDVKLEATCLEGKTVLRLYGTNEDDED
jgi:hypothetical protein